MQSKWYKQNISFYDYLIIVGDIGGTNTNLGLAGSYKDKDQSSKIDLIMETVTPSDEVTDFTECVKATVHEIHAKLPQAELKYCCISGAGPVEGGKFCQLTNQTWCIDGKDIEAKLGLETLVINDFSAISYSLPLLDINNPQQIEVLKAPVNKEPLAQGQIKAVVGPGTGLGVGYLTYMNDRWIALPSEGGHMDFAAYDKETEGFKNYIQDSIDLVPEYEMTISGMGIKNLFYYYLESNQLDKKDPVIVEILRKPDTEKPAVISKNSKTHEGCKKIMTVFVRSFARFSASVACLLLPRSGFYIAGGISAKNLDFFTKDNFFAQEFATHCNPNIRRVLEEIPIYVIKDYSVSLYGAANAALSLMIR